MYFDPLKMVMTLQSTVIAAAPEAHYLIWGKLKRGLERGGKESSQPGEKKGFITRSYFL